MRKLIRACVLVLALAMPAFAGEIPFNVTSPPPPPPASATQQGEIPNDVTGEIPYGVTLSVLVTLLIAPIA